MKKRNLKPPMLTMFLLLTLLCAWLPVGAYDFMVGDLCYNINEDSTSVTVTRQNQNPAYSSLSGAVSIPSTVTNGGKTYSVTSIGKNAFQYCSGLTSVTIPNSVTGIGDDAFLGCRSLTSVTIPNSVTSIGDAAFADCSGLTSVTIPNSVTRIRWFAFSGCSGLTSVTIPNSVTSIGECAFYGCSGLTSVTIPNSVTRIGDYAFSVCSGLTSVVVEAGNATYDSRDNCNAIIETARNTLIAGCKNTTIPNSVTGIGDYAFEGCSGLTSVTIPNSVTGIGEHAFYDCSGLTSVVVEAGNATYDSRDNCNAIIETASNTLIAGCKNTTIPNSVTSIGGYAFYGCSGLTSVTIPNWVTSIGDYAFSGCSGLTSVVVEAGNATYDSRDNCNAIIETASNTLIAGCKNTTIPNSVTGFGEGAFEGCSGLTNVTIPNSVTGIGDSAFFSCSGLTSVTIPNSVTSIGGYAFYGCSNLTNIYCYAETPPIWSSSDPIFDYRSDQTLYVPAASVNAYKQADGWKNFVHIVEMSVPESHTIVFADAVVKKLCVANWDTDGDRELSYDEAAAVTDLGTVFQDNKSIKSFDELQYFTGITAIGTQAFWYCRGLTSVSIPNSVTSIGGTAFYYCSGLTSVTIPNSVTSIGDYAFGNCTGLTSVTIPNSVKSIGEGAFYVCSGLTSVTIPNSVTSIGDYAFYLCSGLTSVTIPNSVTSIGDLAFSCCSGLTSVVVEAGNATYDSRDNCNAIIETASNTLIAGCKNTTIPNSVTSIYRSAFYGCSGLTSVTIPNSVTSIGGHAFYGCTGLTSVTIPNSVTSIDRYAFYGCSGLTSVTISNSVTSIGGYAFDDCSGLTDIYCYAETPPAPSGYGPIFDYRSDQTLYVPAASVDAYKQAEGWMNFTNILPIEQTPEDNEITVYCKADVAPYLYIWEMGTNNQLNGNWPGAKMTQKVVKNGETYWAQTFESAGINLIFNNGSGSQTGDFTNITTDCYFIYNGTSFAYGAIPPEAFSSSNNYVFYVNTDRWSSVSVDLYTSSSSYSRQRMTLLGHDLAGFEVYVWEAESLTATPTQLRFTNGSKYTPTAAFANGGYYVYTFYQNYAVVQLDCVAVMDPDDESQRPQLRDFSLDASANSAEVWNDMTQNKSFTVSGTYFNKYNRNAQLLYSVDGGEWTSLQTLTSDNAFSLTFSARLGRTSKYDLNGDGVIDDADTEYFKSCLESGNCKDEWDFNYDGTVNMGDINWFIDQLNYGSFSNEFAELTSHSLRIAAQDISGTFSTIREYIYYQGNPLTLQVPELTYTGSAITISGAKLVSANGDTFTQGEHFILSDYTNNVNAGTATVTVSGLPGSVPTALAPADASTSSVTVPWEGAQESYNLRYRKLAEKNGFFEDFEYGIPSDWILYDQDGDGNNWYAASSGTDNAGNPTGFGSGMVTSASYNSSSGALTPDNWLVSPEIDLGGELSVWLRGQDPSYADEHFAIYISTTGYTPDDFVDEIVSETIATGVLTEYKADLSNYAGQRGWIAIRHFNCTDMFRLNVDNFYVKLGEEIEYKSITIPGGVIGTTTKQFTISPATLSGTIALANAADAEVTYTGSAIKPAVTLTHTQHGILEADKDYTLSYRNNTKPGQATVTATGKGNYTGSLSTTFTIAKAPLPSDVAVVTIEDDILYDGEAHEATVNRSQLSGLGTATVTYFRDGAAISGAPVEPGNYTVNVAFAEGECYLGGTIENAAAFTIYALDATDWASVKALYNATGGASWSKTVDVSDVKYARQLVDRGLATIVKGRVTALNLSGNNLSGELPATGVSLSALTSLNISGNNLTGNLGAFTAPMTSLRSLNAANNRIATLYPQLPASVSNASLYPQNVDVTLDVDLPNLDIEALMASFPSIFLYDPSSRAYSRLPGVTATGGNDWWASFTFNGTRLVISGVSSQNLYYGASGDVLPVTVTNGGSGTQTLGTMSARLTFAQGDADFNGATNVVDLQAIINQIFAMFDGSKPFNWTAANVIVDEKLNVQDVVGEVNLLLANNSGAGMRRRAPQAGDDGHGTPAGAANLYWRDGVLYLASDKPVAALDVILAGDVKWDIARYGLTVGTRGSHTVAYSLTGGSIPAGVTPVATALEAVAPAVTAAMLSDTAALEIPVSLTDPDITGVNDIAASPAVRLVVDGSAIIVEATTPLAETGWAIAAIDGKLIAAGKGDLSAGRTQLAADLSTGAYVVSLTAADGTAVRTKVVIR